MKVRVMRWDYPTDVNQGLDDNKRWYEFQLVEDKEIEMSTDEIAQVIADAAEQGRYLAEDAEGLPIVFTDANKCYTFPKDYFEV